MSALVQQSSALPSVEKARALIVACVDKDEVKNIRAVAQAVATRERGEELGRHAGKIVVECNCRIAALESEDRKARPKHNEKTGNGVVARSGPLPKSQTVAESRRAPLLRLSEREKDNFFKACDKAKIAPTTEGAAVIARLEPEERKAAIAKLGDVASVAAAVREVKREKVKAELEDVAAQEVKAATGVFDVIVIDPPWPIAKIERDARPNQVELDYPTMSLDELRELSIPCADDAHVWLWTTHRFLPDAFALLEAWGLKYVCCFVWHKPGGFQPIGLPQYNCEFALYARRGTPSFVDTKALPTAFEAPRGKHSEKPESFYDVVRRVTAGRRLDMFNRRPIDGFDTWGNQRG